MFYTVKNHTFNFKQFAVRQDRCAMKIGTDSVLLACLVDKTEAKNILDIGTGSGVLALMMAQKYNAIVDAVEIDGDAYMQAKDNFYASKWKDKINIFHTAIQQFFSPTLYDIIICNPPYYKQHNNISIANPKRLQARHDKDLLFNELCNSVYKMLDNNGCFYLVLPLREAQEFKSIAMLSNLNLHKQFYIKPKPNKNVNRVAMCFTKTKINVIENTFTIYDNNGLPTPEYYNLTRDFYL